MAHLGDRLAHDLRTIAVDQGGEPLLTGRERGGLGLDVADALVGNADVGQDDGQDFLVHLALLEELHRRQAQAFLLDLGGAGRETARHHAADIGPVAGIGQPGEQLPPVEERLHEAHVHQMGATEIGIVDDEHVARIDLAGIVALHPLDHRLGRELHGAHEYRQAELALGDQRTVGGIVDAVRAVHALGDNRREGGAHKGKIHLVADLDQAVLDDGQRDGIEVGHGL